MKKIALIFSLIIFDIFIHIVNSSEKDFLGLQSEIGAPDQIKYSKTNLNDNQQSKKINIY
jgi:hypothetical protein